MYENQTPKRKIKDGWTTLCINSSATQPKKLRVKWVSGLFLHFLHASEENWELLRTHPIENNNILIEPQNSINVFFNIFDYFLWYAIIFNFFKNVIIQIEIYQNFEKRKAYFLRLISFNLWKIVIITPSRIPTWRQRTSQNMSRLSLTHQLGWVRLSRL